MFWTGTQRDASSVLTEQKQNIPGKLEFLKKMRGQAQQLHQLATAGPFDPVAFGRILDETWQMKRQLASTISSQQIDAYYNKALEAGAEGGKLCGAGNGGFLLFLATPEKQPAVRKVLSELLEVPIRFEVHGSRVLLPFEQ